MHVERFYLDCLAHASYVIADRTAGTAAVVDPQRDIQQYLDYLSQHDLRLQYVLETHLHADFVSGHVELAEKTGAEIVFGAAAGARMNHRAVQDGDELPLGTDTSIRVLETPGHTPDSVCYLVRNTASGEPGVLFSGDTVFVGDVGRPDLLGARIAPQALADMMFDTIQNKIKSLPDATRIYPAHGAGSSCGRTLGTEAYTTIAQEKATNYAFKIDDRREFIEAITIDQPHAPKYFAEDAVINRGGAPDLDSVLANVRELDVAAFRAAQAAGAFVLDTRDPEDFAAGFIPGSVNIGLDGSFAGWVGTIVPGNAKILLVAEDQSEVESALRCARIGYDNVVGFLKGNVRAWREAGLDLDTNERLEPGELQELLAHESDGTGLRVLDVRKDTERNRCFVPGSKYVTLSDLEHNMDEIPKDENIVVYCQGGYRSSIAVGLLRKHGHKTVRDVRGGIKAYRESGAPVAEPAPAGS